MNLLALKMLTGDRLKFFGLLFGMAFAAMMIAQQASIFVGLESQTGSFIRELAAVDLWVMDDQVRFSEDSQPIPETALHRIRGIDGVAWAVPLYKGWLRIRLQDGTRTAAIIVGVDDATLVGAPAEMVSGSPLDLRRDKAVFIDERDAGTKLAHRRSGGDPTRTGDRISINDREVVVSGVYRSSPSFFWDPVLYTTYSRALAFTPQERNLMSFVLVKLRAGADPARVKRLIAERTPYVARTGPEFERVTSAFILKSTGILVNFGMAVGLGFIIGILSTGQTLFNFTLDNLRYMASLKAMGAGSLCLMGMLATQVGAMTLLSFGVGVGVAALTGRFIEGTDLAFKMPWQILAGTGVAMFAIAMLAGLVSLAKVLRLEPGIVFK
ncbi:MAG: ABC transporter permease [Phycisphaerae bacterium]|nr:ABC transporter permease [Phycisphaerae bacterium]